MDLSLPVLNGWQATRQIKAAADTKHMPVIAMSLVMAHHDMLRRRTFSVANGEQPTWRALLRRHGASRMTSRPKDFHLRALPEPCMTLSSHTAPNVRPLP
jgi:CheY-like chemotaxis protein